MKLHFVLADNYRTCMAIVHENEYVPYRKRITTTKKVGMKNCLRLYRRNRSDNT